MPQLDSLSWFDQVGSTLCVIFIFYFLLSLIYLPMLNAVNKGRYKLQNLRVVLISFFEDQFRILLQDNQQKLALLLFNNVNLINYYYAPLFNVSLQSDLVKNIYNSESHLIIEEFFLNKAVINSSLSIVNSIQSEE